MANLTVDELSNIFIDNDLIQDYIGTQTTNEDLMVGSSIINTINNYTDNINFGIPRISIWSQENSPVHWRLLSSAMYGNDHTLVNMVHDARGVYNTMYIVNLSASIACGVGGFFAPWCWFESADFLYKAYQWRKGRNWIDDSENIWSALIKTSRLEPYTHWELVYPCDDWYYWDELSSPGTNCGTPEWQSVTYYVSVNYPSDGLLPEYTQELQGIPSGNRYKVNGANHLEVLNMSSSPQGDITKQRFDEIFNRHSPDWFHTD